MHTLDSSPRAIAYFDDVSRPDGGAEDYFSGRGDKTGRWVGSGLSNVGLIAGEEVEREALHRALFSGEHPLTGEPLGQRIRRGDGIAGFGMTFSAPKSVSLLWALGSQDVAEKVEAAEAAAVDAGIAYFERHAVYARRGRNGIEQIDGGGLIGAAFSHRTSRECDPQLHTHVLVANRTLCEDGRWRTLDSRGGPRSPGGPQGCRRRLPARPSRRAHAHPRSALGAGHRTRAGRHRRCPPVADRCVLEAVDPGPGRRGRHRGGDGQPRPDSPRPSADAAGAPAGGVPDTAAEGGRRRRPSPKHLARRGDRSGLEHQHRPVTSAATGRYGTRGNRHSACGSGHQWQVTARISFAVT